MEERTASAQVEVAAYYDHQVDREWLRLTRHRVEYGVTLRAIRDSLPLQARVLDVGGGPGRYAVALAAAGHDVTLLDLSPRMLARARAHANDRKVRLVELVEGTATDLSRFTAGSFDAVLLLGPLYHLPVAEDRFHALRECRRVLVPGGTLLAAFLTRYAPLRYLARTDPRLLLRDAERYETLLECGVLPEPFDMTLPHAYHARPEEIPPLLQASGFDVLRLLAAEGIVDGVEERVSALQGPAWEAWADLNYDLASDPGLLAASAHVLAIARRRDDDLARVREDASIAVALEP
ncbi:MAG TPA: class I SAM-dependent methyltransferase [Chloroflexota bacterium]|nr:class I SAM-dependent methyltransferase [Chloroflexota bacterium]